MEDYTHVNAWRLGFLNASTLAGFISGACTTVVGHPLDTLKVQLQVGSLYRPNVATATPALTLTTTAAAVPVAVEASSSLNTSSISSLSSGSISSSSTSAGINQTSRHISTASIGTSTSTVTRPPISSILWKNGNTSASGSSIAIYSSSWSHKMRRLYRGIAPPLLTAGGVQATYFTIYEHNKSLLRRYIVDNEGGRLLNYHWETFIAGSVAGCLISIITNPISLVKIQLQTSTDLTTFSCYRSIYSNLGFHGFYKGMSLMIVMESIGRGAYLHCYEVCKRYINNTEDESKFTIYSKMASASIAGCYSWLIVYPLDVIKSRIQCASCTLINRSVVDTFKNIVAESGIKGLYRGVSFTMLRAVPTASISLPLYEYCRDAIAKVMGT